MNTINKTLLFIAALGVSTLAIANGSLLVEPSDLAEEISNGAVKN